MSRVHLAATRHRPSNIGSQALSSDGLVDSIGVNIHTNYTNTPYFTAFSTVMALIADLGIRHVRDSIKIVNSINLGTLSATGVKFSLVTGGFGSTLGNGGTTSQEVALINSIGADGIDYMEGVNEPDIQGDATWQADTLTNQQSMWNAIHGASGLSGIQFAGPSIVSPGNNGIPSGILPYMNYINIHRYLGSGGATFTPEQDVAAILGSSLAGAYGSSLPVIVTESGAYGSTAAPTTDRTNGNMSFAAEAVYLPRMFMAWFAGGIVRSYRYELIDQSQLTGGGQYFGLVLSNFTPKLSYYTTKNLIVLCADPGSPFTPGKLDYALSGSLTNVRNVLLGKRDGSFILSLVQAVAIWNEVTMVDITAPAPQSVTITLGAGTGMGHYQTATLSTTSTMATWSTGTAISGNAFTVSVTASLLLVRITA